ncbi:MAG: oligosaccharide flippase family protein [Lewinella sp.]|uniref:oligosaccharide flippase family protein n=1 Tax=Lewinella sp. TaxID=2004506 RepID=UPI003D6C54F2
MSKPIGEKQSNFFQAFWVGIGALSSFGLSIISAAILSRYFDKLEYGTYKQILFIYNSLLILFTAGLPKVFAFFLPRFSLAQGKEIVVKITGVLAICGLVFSFVLFFGSNAIAYLLNNSEVATGLRIFAPIPLLLLPTLGLEGIFATYRKTYLIAIYNALSRLVLLACILVPVIIFGGTYLSAIYGWIVGSVLILIMALFFKQIPFRGINAKDSNLPLKEILAYSLPIVGASIAGVAIRSADQFYISRYFGAEAFAEYSNGFVQLPFVSMITGATSLVLMPQFSKILHEKEGKEELLRLWKSALKKSATLIYPMVIFFLFTAEDFVVLLYTERYRESALYFQMAMGVNFFNIIIFAPLLMAMGEIKYYAYIHTVCAVFIWVMGSLLVSFVSHPIAIAALSVLTTILLVLLALFRAGKVLEVSLTKLIPLSSLFKISLFALCIIGVMKISLAFLLHYTVVVRLFITGGVFFTSVFLLSPFVGIDYKWVSKPLINKLHDAFGKKSIR